MAERFARNAFERLTGTVQTAVSVVVYEVNGTGLFLDSVTGVYDGALASRNGGSRFAMGRCDCADDSVYTRTGTSRGLTVLYRARRFGRPKDKVRHSGWECRGPVG